MRALLANKFFVAALAVFLIFMSTVEYKQYKQRQAVQKEIADLQSQASQIEQKNQNLQNLISNLNSTGYKQASAREQLNLKKNGEVVYSFVQPGASPLPAGAGGQDSQSGLSNAQKWWNYFFHP